MKILDNLKIFFKKFFSKKESYDLLDKAKSDNEKSINTNKSDFMESLKQNVKKKKKARVETMVCVGDGLGINNKIEY